MHNGATALRNLLHGRDTFATGKYGQHRQHRPKNPATCAFGLRNARQTCLMLVIQRRSYQPWYLQPQRLPTACKAPCSPILDTMRHRRRPPPPSCITGLPFLPGPLPTPFQNHSEIHMRSKAKPNPHGTDGFSKDFWGLPNPQNLSVLKTSPRPLLG